MKQKYGPWAVVAGASEGIGAAFARALAERGFDLILVARRRQPLEDLAATLKTTTIPVAADLADGIDPVKTAAEGKEIGLVVANAAYSPIGSFVDQDPEKTTRALDLNCRAPLLLAHAFLPAMVQRGRGGFILMSSLAGMQGSPRIATYAGTKAFGAVFAESLWAELRGTGVDVLGCVAGAVATPGLAASKARRAPGTRTPEQVVASALGALGRGPRVVPGPLMRVSSAVMSRLLPRRTAIALIDRASRDLAGN